MVFIGLPSRRRLSSASCVSERGKDWVTRWRHICKQAAWFTHTVPARSRTSRGCGTWDYRGRSRRQERRSLFAKTLGSAATITKTETVSRQAGRGKKKMSKDNTACLLSVEESRDHLELRILWLTIDKFRLAFINGTARIARTSSVDLLARWWIVEFVFLHATWRGQHGFG